MAKTASLRLGINKTDNDQTECYGLLVLSNGTRIEMDGCSVAKVRANLQGRSVTGIGEDEIGDEANVEVVSAKEGEEGETILSSSDVEEINSFFNN